MEHNTNYRFNSQIVNPNKKKSKKNLILTLLLLAFNIGIIIYIAYTSFVGVDGSMYDQSIAVFNLWKKNFKYLAIALALPLVAVWAESMKFAILTRHRTGVWNFRLGLRTTIMGKYYDNVTPMSSGGQPFQIYYLNKDGVPLGTATSFPFISFFLNQLALVIITVAIMIYLRFADLGSVDATFNAIKVIAYIGLVFSIIVPVAIIGVSIWPKLTKKIANFIVKVMGKLKFIRHQERHANTIYKTLDDYQTTMSQFKNKQSMGILLICFFFSFIYKFALMSVPYFVIRGCGVTPNYFEIFALTVLITVSVAIIPTPGNSGAAELTFQSIFKGALLSAGLGAAFTFWNMLLWRVCVYYMFIILGIIELVIIGSKRKRKKAYVPIPVIETLYQIKVKGLKFVHKDFTSTIIPVDENDVKIYLSDVVASCEISPRNTMRLDSKQDFTCLTDNAYIFVSKECIKRIIKDLDDKKLYGLTFVVDRNIKLGPSMDIDTGREKSPLDFEDTLISTVQFVDYYFPLEGYTAFCAHKNTLALNDLGYPTRVYTPKLKKKLGDFETNYPIVKTPSIRFFFTDYAWAIPKYNIQLKYSLEPMSVLVYHTHTPFMMGRYALKMSRRYDVPLVGSFRHFYYHGLKKPLGNRLLARIVDTWGLGFYKRCDAVFVPSVESGELLKSCGYRGDYMVVNDAYEKLDDKEIRRVRSRTRDALKVDKSRFVISFIVKTKEEKEHISKLVGELRKIKHLNITVLVYGFSFLERNFINVNKNQRGVRVNLLPHSTDVSAMIASSNVLALPRSRKDAMPYERIAATYKIPTFMRGFEDENYIPNENCYLYLDDVEKMAAAIKAIYDKKEERLLIGKNAWETLTIAKEESVQELEKAYRIVIRRYYETTRK